MNLRNVVVDTDTGVDDALALIYLARTQNISIRAVHSTHGNCTPIQAANNAQAVLERCGLHDVDVRVGRPTPTTNVLPLSSNIHGNDGLGNSGIEPAQPVESTEDAPENLVALANEQPGAIDLLALGPLTNVAAALRFDPELLHKLRSVTIVGSLGPAMFGDREPWLDRRFRVSRDPNVSHDIEAAVAVANATGNVTWCGPYITRQALVPESVFHHIAAQTQDPAATLITEISRFYADFYTDSYPQPGGERVMGINDGIAAVVLAEPDFVLSAVHRPMERFDDDQGVGYLAGVHTSADDPRPVQRVVFDVDFQRVIDQLTRSLQLPPS